MNTATIISADQHERLRQFLKDLWEYRELFLTFLERDLKVRYKQTALGVIWVVLQPLCMSGAFALIFGRLGGMPTDGMPTMLFYFAALVPWSTFASALSQSAMSLENQAGLITKIYFPRMVIPGASVCGSLLDFAIGWALLNAVAAWMGCWHWQLLAVTLPLLAIQTMCALGLGLVLGALNAEYRDVKHAMAFLVQLLMLATPVIYPASQLPAWLQPWLCLNPMAGVVTGFRASLRGGDLPWQLIGTCALTAAAACAVGVWFFRKREARLADIL